MRQIATGESPVHGTGVFAKETLKTGDYIGRYHGYRTEEDSMYTLWVEHSRGERGYFGTGRLRHLNHSKRPNAEFESRDLYATRRIESGDEILIDYGEEWADVP
ncbi:MAG: SET domain-containing protein-lysine N-methyltransferase [Planctomycetes bacterium]|jgi:SET domain-containing protein|nr:SET domain-containing protein-lysine N-methyltransferase [Planctomycetota bacterium]